MQHKPPKRHHLHDYKYFRAAQETASRSVGLRNTVQLQLNKPVLLTASSVRSYSMRQTFRHIGALSSANDHTFLTCMPSKVKDQKTDIDTEILYRSQTFQTRDSVSAQLHKKLRPYGPACTSVVTAKEATGRVWKLPDVHAVGALSSPAPAWLV